MPYGDGTGPNGQGPMTGRGVGYCSGNSVPGFMVPGFGRGMAFRRGFGRGRGFRWRARVMPVQPQVVPVVQEPQMTETEE
ncbi:MAG: DUF5320 domain-containing protein, partial [Candidatus Thorarchaeota archaeon]